MKRAGRTPALRGPHGEPLPNSIAEVRYLRLGGVDQWVLIRGADVANPPLVLLHGGPGFSETHFFRYFNAPLEQAFTVVYWDQRGSGKSFDPKLAASSLTVEQLVRDLDELVGAVRRRVGRKPVVILGHSWGSVLGVLYAARFPDKVSAYVGCAQIGDSLAGESASYAHALAAAERLGNGKALAALRAIGAPPYSAEALWTERMWSTRLDGQLSPRVLWGVLRTFLGVPELSIADLPNLMRGFRFTLDAMWPEVSRIDLIERVPALEVPTVFFLGRRDHWVPAETSVAFIEALKAPSKRTLWFEESGHEAFVDEAAKFNQAMVELVRPLVARVDRGHGATATPDSE